MITTKNARFQIWHNGGWVKVTLKPGQTITVHEGGPTDEGYSHEVSTYSHGGDGVYSEYHSFGRDCDGNHEYHSSSFCPLDDLKARDMYDETGADDSVGIFAPLWERSSASQYDQYAELAGY